MKEFVAAGGLHSAVLEVARIAAASGVDAHAVQDHAV
jgi:hypothetical protein